MKWTNLLWDAALSASIMGLWPRFIEPKWITLSKLNLSLTGASKKFNKIKIVQLSDLHFNRHLSDRFLKRLHNKIKSESPDLLVFTGDFLCCSKVDDIDRLELFLKSLHAPLGCFAVFGNHDYSGYVSINRQGDYDLIEEETSPVFKGFERLFSSIKLTQNTTSRALALKPYEPLVKLLKKCAIQPLHNELVQLPIGDGAINICGLGEHMLGQMSPEKAFSQYDSRYPTLVLVHNPDALKKLMPYPGDLILSGHTHGGQINLPYLWKKFSLLENSKFRHGLFRENTKWLYVSRGLGGVWPFRLCAPPEIVSITLEVGCD